MGDIYRAFSYLNKTLKLGLTKPQIWRVEKDIKLDFSIYEKYSTELTRDPDKLMEDWEFKTVLVPRKKPITAKDRAALKAAEKKSK